MSNIDVLKKFVERRPECIAAYGYGSKIFTQLGYDSKTKAQYDLIFIVENLNGWHKLNVLANPKDYSYLGKKFLTNDGAYKLKGFTGMTYQSNIIENNHVFKYGVIELNDFIRALTTWTSFYVTGRFQKPVLEIKSNNVVRTVIEQNRKDGLYTSLLIMDDNKKYLVDLYETLCSLSYLGDSRMKVAEDPNKIINIVGGNFDFFYETYGTGNNFFSTNHDGIITKNEEALIESVDSLPSDLLNYLDYSNCNKEDLLSLRENIIDYLTTMNRIESNEQTLKALKTNGIVRSVKYAVPKVMKKIKSL